MVVVKKLDNNITVLLSQDEQASTACVLVGVGIGANHEEEHEHGLAHFFEHMCFKGTETYPTNIDLVTRIEKSGLIANAYTGKEFTAYYLVGRAERVEDMVAITADIFLRSIFPENDVGKEKKVITEEIAMYQHDPPSRAFNEVEISLFHGTAAGHHILGTKESVQSFSRNNFTHFLEKHYRTGNIIISIAGRFDEEEVMKNLDKEYKGALQGGHTPQIVIAPEAVKDIHHCVTRSDLEQTHIVIGGYMPAYTSTDKYTAEVFDTVLGGSMSSRLFLRVREKLGACYTIKTYTDTMAHIGAFYIHTGIAQDRTEEVMEAIADECVKIKKTQVNEDELQKAKELLLGIESMQQEKKRTVASTQMHAYAQSGKPETRENYKKGIVSTTVDDVQRMANTILNGKKMSTCYVSNTEIDRSITEMFCQRIG